MARGEPPLSILNYELMVNRRQVKAFRCAKSEPWRTQAYTHVRRSKTRAKDDKADGPLTQPPSCINVEGSDRILPAEPSTFNPGNDLLSHTVTRAVSSAQEGLTTVFGMGTGVTPPPWPPGNFKTVLSVRC